MHRLLLLLVILTRLSAHASPDNDHFANRQELAGNDVQFTVYRLHATREANEPKHTLNGDARLGYASVWFSWTAPGDGLVMLSESFNSGTLCVVYEGNDLESLIPVVSADSNLRLRFPVGQGRTYHIAASQAAIEEPPPTSQLAHWTLQFFGPPVNDMFADRIHLGGNVVALNGHTLGATREAGEPLHADVAIPNTVWWEWTPPSSGLVWIQGAPSFPGRLRAYTGSDVNQLTPIPMPETFDRFSVTAGIPVQIVVGPYAPSLEGPVPLKLVLSQIQVIHPENGSSFLDGSNARFVLTNVPPGVNRITLWDQAFSAEVQISGSEFVLTNLVPGKYRFEMVASDDTQQLQYWLQPFTVSVRPGSDAIADAREILPTDNTIGGDFATATLEPGEPNAAIPIQGSIWWRWTAPAGGRVILRAGPYANVVARDIFRTNATGQPVSVATAEPLNPMAEPVTFSAEEGVTYFIRLWQPGFPRGWAATGFLFLREAENDQIIDAAELLADGAPRTLDRTFVSCEPNEVGPCELGTGSRWYRLTPAGAGKLDLSLESWFSIEHQTSISVFHGAPGALTVVSAAALQHSLILEPSRTYYIRVQTPLEYPESIDIRLTAKFGIFPPNDDVANALLLSAAGGTLQGSTYLATTEVDQPPNISGDDSIWYRFSAPHHGTLVARVTRTPASPAHYNPQVAFARGPSAATLTWAEEQSRWGNVAAIDLNTGDEILLSVWANHITGESNVGFVMEYFFVPHPANDNFGDRILLEGTEMQFRGTNWNATREPNEPAGNFAANRSVWWEWVAPTNGALRIATDLTEIDLFTGTETNLVLLSTTLDERQFAGGFVFPVIAGNHYFLRGSWNDSGMSPPFGEEGLREFEMDLRLGTSLLVSPTNRAVYLEPDSINFEASALLPNYNGNTYSVTFFRGTNELFAVTRRLELGTVFDPPYRLELTNIFPGHHLVQGIVTNDQGEAFPTVVARIRVAPSNDELTNAFVLSGRYLEGTASLSGSTQNGENGVPPQNGTVWYQWTPPADGRIRWTAIGQSITDLFFSTNAVSKITNIANLRSLGRLNNNSSTAVSIGSNYWIRINASTNGIGKLITIPFKLEQTTISFAAPGPGAILPGGSPATIRITTTERPDQIAGVELFHGTNFLSSIPGTNNFEYVWSNPPAGIIQVIARPVLTSGEPTAAVTNTFTVRAGHDLMDTPELLPDSLTLVTGNWDGATGTNSSALKDLWYQWTAPAEGLLFAQFTNTTAGQDFQLFAPVIGTNGVIWVSQENLASPFSAIGNWKVQPGVTYLLAVYGDSSARGPFGIQLQFVLRSSNDDFANRIVLNGAEGQVATQMALTTLELGEPAHDEIGLTVHGSAWYTWTPPFDGLLAVYSTNNSIAQFVVRPWVGESLSGLTKHSTAVGWGTWFGGPVYYSVRGGIPLHFAVSTTSERLITIPWNWQLIPSPLNDNYTNRFEVRGRDLVLSGSLAGATRESFESSSFLSSVWWNWTAEDEGYLRIQLSDSPGVEGEVYLGKTPQTFDQHVRIFSHVSTEWRVKPGDVLELQIGASVFMDTDFQVHLQMTGLALNDDFADRETLSGSLLQFEADNRLATREFREPNHAGEFGGRSVWYRYTPAVDGTLQITKNGYSEYLLLAAYHGTNVTNLNHVASSLITAEGGLQFEVEAGREYAIAVDNAAGYAGANPLKLTFAARPTPPLLEVSLNPDGNFVFEPSDPGNWVLEQSEDLIDWIPVNPSPSGIWTVDPRTNPGSTLRFYRLRSE